MQATLIPYNVCFAFSQVCSDILICNGWYLHGTPGHSFLFEVVEIYSREFGLKLKLDLGLEVILQYRDMWTDWEAEEGGQQWHRNRAQLIDRNIQVKK